MAFASGLYIFLEVFFVRVEFDESFIYPFSPWRGKRQIPWSDVVSSQFSNVNKWHVIRTRTHGTLRISIYLSGAANFLERLHKAIQGEIMIGKTT